MTADIHRLPVRPALRVVPAYQPHFEAELREIAMNLHAASGHFTMKTETAIEDGSEALEAALFHALTLKGCRNEDRALRDLLLRRVMQREEAPDAE